MKKLRPLRSFEIKGVYRLPLILLCIFLAIGIYPGIGGEGAQREVLRFQDKHDFSGFFTPFVYGFWPDSWISWLFSLSVVQVAIYSAGMKLFFTNLSNNTLRKIFIFIYIVGVFFVFQVVRDATAFSLFVFGFGMISKSSKSKNSFHLLGVGAIIIGCFFKPILAPIIAIIYLFFSTMRSLTIKLKLTRLVIAIFIAFAPFFIDKGITSELGLDKRYPEQQLFIYDVTKMYCWGHKSSNIELAKKSISPFLQMSSDHESLCASLEPMGADDLRRKLIEVKDSPAIELYKGENSSVIQELFLDWLKLIKESPFEWLQIKAIDASQVLFMANAIYLDPVVEGNSNNILLEIGDRILEASYIPIKVLDKLRIYSLGFSLVIGLLLIYVNGRFISLDRSIDKIVYKYIVINLSIWFMFTLLFISNPGRYTTPYLLLSYIYLITSIDEKVEKYIKRFSEI